MRLDEALRTIQEIISRNDTGYSDYREERVAGQVKSSSSPARSRLRKRSSRRGDFANKVE
jgi:hypothetical protein